MKILKTLIIAGLLNGLATAQAPAQFSSGSDGSYGPLNITNDTTLTVESNGIYNCTTIYVATNVTLRFLKNGAAGNFPVHLLATSNVVVDGIVDVSGQNGSETSGAGGPGGFDGGEPGIALLGVAPGDGLGPGGGKQDAGLLSGLTPPQTWAGSGSFAFLGSAPSVLNLTNASASTYGNRLVMPLIGGSGGGGGLGSPGRGGGGGGGAILIASSTSVTVRGQILARGRSGSGAGYNGVTSHSGNGSGGAVRIVAPEVVGTGSLDVSGSAYSDDPICRYANGGGAGWIRIDTLNRTQIGFTFNGMYSIGSFMQVFPSPLARLSIIQAAGTNIVEGQTEPVLITLPWGSSTNQTVTVRARDFVGTVPISVVLTPESGPSSKYDDVISMGSTNVAEKTVSVVMPVNTLTRIHAWTR